MNNVVAFDLGVLVGGIFVSCLWGMCMIGNKLLERARERHSRPHGP